MMADATQIATNPLGYGITTAFDAAHAGAENYPDYVAPDVLSGWLTGQQSRGDYDAWLQGEASAQDARVHDEFMLENQLPMKVAGAIKAGFSPLAALENVGSTPSSASGASSAHHSPNNFGSVLGAVLSSVLTMATKGMALNASAEAAKDMEMIKQNNRLALAAILSKDKDQRLLTSLANKTDLFNERMAFEESLLAKKFEYKDLASAKDSSRSLFRDYTREQIRRGLGSKDADAMENGLLGVHMGSAWQELDYGKLRKHKFGKK